VIETREQTKARAINGPFDTAMDTPAFRANQRIDFIMKVLVVDDNHLLASLICEVLEQEGCEVMTAKDGIDGYSFYLRFEPDLIITDIQMPRRNGLEMMKCIRTHDPTIPTIYMSGDKCFYRSSLLEEEKKYSVSFLEKPFPLRHLMQVVSRSTAEPIPKNAVNDY
jgi:two-component system chemotaxis response regulator CheY